jgi:hypothetical protein
MAWHARAVTLSYVDDSAHSHSYGRTQSHIYARRRANSNRDSGPAAHVHTYDAAIVHADPSPYCYVD